MGTGASDSAGLSAIVARIPFTEAAEEMAAELEAHMPAFEHLSVESRVDVVAGLGRTLRRWSRFLSTGVMPADGDFAPLREWTRSRAEEGVRLEELLHSFGLAHQVGWRLLRRHARRDESEALLDLAAALAAYVDRVSAIVTETYLTERELLVSEEERRTRNLIDRLCVDAPPDAATTELADRLNVPIERTYVPFAAVLPGRPPHSHAALAARLRRAGGLLAMTQSDSVVGLAWEALELADLREGPAAILAIGEPTARAQLGAAREEVAVLGEHARRAGLSGALMSEDYLLEILLGSTPRPAARLRSRIVAPLMQEGRGELATTLQALIASRLDRTATSALLHIHRNTLAHRLRRIEEITGVDLASPRDLASVYVALAGETTTGAP